MPAMKPTTPKIAKPSAASCEPARGEDAEQRAERQRHERHDDLEGELVVRPEQPDDHVLAPARAGGRRRPGRPRRPARSRRTAIPAIGSDTPSLVPRPRRPPSAARARERRRIVHVAIVPLPDDDRVTGARRRPRCQASARAWAVPAWASARAVEPSAPGSVPASVQVSVPGSASPPGVGAGSTDGGGAQDRRDLRAGRRRDRERRDQAALVRGRERDATRRRARRRAAPVDPRRTAPTSARMA